MRLRNHTGWSGASLRGIIAAVAAEELDPKQRTPLVVDVYYANANGARDDRYTRRAGNTAAARAAGLRFNRFCVTVPKPRKDEPTWTDLGWLGVQLAHEMAECRGKAHKNMRSARYFSGQWGGNGGLYWRRLFKDAGLVLLWDPKVTPTVTPTDRAIARLANAREKLLEWERRERLASRRRAKWAKRVRAYENRLGAAAQQDTVSA